MTAKYQKMAVSSRTDLKTRKFYVAVFAEFVGTMLLVLVSCGSTLQGTGPVQSATVRIALTFAFSVGSIVWAIGNVSGGNINPGVTIAFFVTRRMSLVGFLLYITAQTLGGIAGAAILYALAPESYNGNLGTPGLSTGVSVVQGFFVEMFLVFILVLVVFASCDELRGDVGGSVPLQIGVAIGMCHLWGVPLTGAGMNPARAFGPAVISNNLETNHWLYWVGPLVGGMLAGLLYEFLFAVNATPAKLKGFFTRNYDAKDYDASGKRPMTNDLPLK